jgi:RsiW-degrading membrane proteinase PrsW (M82 family)
MGYYFGLAKFTPSKRLLYLALAFVVPWLLHGFYDFVIMANIMWLLLVFVAYLIFMYIYGFRRIRELARYKVEPVEESIIITENFNNEEQNLN